MTYHVFATGVLLATFGVSAFASADVLDFHLLTWPGSHATAELPSAEGLKPVKPFPTVGDWLVFTDDDQILPASNNPQGSLSHNFADLDGSAGTAGFNMAPSLSGSLQIQLNQNQTGDWDVAVTHLAYHGQVNSMISMDQYLVTPDSAITQNTAYAVDGLGNSGRWNGGIGGNWSIQYNLDFYFDANISLAAVDVAFNDKSQAGYLIPVENLTASDLSGLAPLGFYDGEDFGLYLRNEIKPRLPEDAGYLLVTQMSKINPDYTVGGGFPLMANGTVGNLTIAYAVIPEPTTLAIMGIGGVLLLRRRRRTLICQIAGEST